ncbi:MAG: peptide ABC transporter substrate-binding protein [Dehalococcoidales bacterium]|jgi:oligopeptide transport system substrate-binding protein
MKKLLLLLMLLAVCGCLLLTACPNNQTTTPSPATTTPSTGSGTLKLYGTDPYTLDPAVSGDMNSYEYIAQIFNGLVKLDSNLEPAPDIAENWTISDDHLTYTFTLRKDVVFQDGKKVTAADFKYSWERAADPATGSTVVATYLGDIVGVKDVMAGQTKEISGVKVLDDYTLQVTIDAPRSYFLSKLTYPTAMVVDKTNVAAGSGWWYHPNGTGPFILKEWQTNTLIVLERNPRFYGEKARLQEVRFLLWAGIPMNLYELGQIDVADVYTDYIDRVEDTAGTFYTQLQVKPELSFSWLGFNTTQPPFDDVNIRKAFSMAIDKDKIIALTLRNMNQRADGILPPGIPGYNENVAGLGFDVAQAKALIAASSYGDVSNLPPIVLTTSGYGGAISSVLEAIITQWRENLGVEVTVRALDPERYIYYLQEEKDNLFDMGWIADYPHPQDFLDVLFHSGAENNYGGYANAAVDALLDTAGVEPDAARSLDLYRQAEQALVDDAAIIPLWFGENYVLVKPYVKGYELNEMGFAWLNKVSIEE